MEEQEVYLIAENDDGKVPENGDIVRDERTNRYYRLVRPAEEPILELWGKVKQAYFAAPLEEVPEGQAAVHRAAGMPMPLNYAEPEFEIDDEDFEEEEEEEEEEENSEQP